MNEGDESAARSALAIAERLEDLELRCIALAALSDAALVARDFDRACAATDEMMALLARLPNPDTHSTALIGAIFTYLRAGRLDQAARASAQAIEVAAGLTPHHRLHGAGWQNLLVTLTGRWDQVRAQAAEAERAVDANVAAGTPCVLHVSVLLNCATASVLAGDEDEAAGWRAKPASSVWRAVAGTRAGSTRPRCASRWPATSWAT